MISVKVTYLKQTKKNNDFYFFTDFEVTGHADGSDNNENIKCCAGVTSCLFGMRRMVSGIYDKLEISKGYFHYQSSLEPIMNKKIGIELDTHYGLNYCLCALYEIYMCYPQFFKSFELIERGKI